jgi:ADP-heptose:LPS heptosyltransferase
LIECRDEPAVTLPRVIVHPGAASEARRWPWTRWALVARAAEQAGFEVLLTAGPGEEALASALADASGLSADCVIAGLDLADLAELLNTAACVASTDTGVAHLATALRTRSVILFGPVTPSTWGPTIDNPRHTVIWRGRTGDPHSAGPDPGLLEIDARTVAAAVIGQASRAVMSFRPDAGKGVR